MKLIIQIPCYNEEKTLPQTVADLPKSIEGIDQIEYLIIDDGSIDKTVAVAKALGVHHIVSFKKNKGLARGFMAGIEACISLGANIIVNTDADNQYCGADIGKLVKPILEEEADIVVGERPIDDIEHFSWKKKKFQRLGSWVVRAASNTEVPDAPSGFRAYSREAALSLNVTNEYTYTLETIIQAGQNRMAITSVPIRTNPVTRKSRLFSDMWEYIKRSAVVIIRAFMMYRPMKFFFMIGSCIFIMGFLVAARFLYFYFTGEANGHIQSLILSTILMLLGAQTIFMGLQADLIARNRKILEDVQYRVRKVEASRERL